MKRIITDYTDGRKSCRDTAEPIVGSGKEQIFFNQVISTFIAFSFKNDLY